jgi:hypothetical protein
VASQLSFFFVFFGVVRARTRKKGIIARDRGGGGGGGVSRRRRLQPLALDRRSAGGGGRRSSSSSSQAHKKLLPALGSFSDPVRFFSLACFHFSFKGEERKKSLTEAVA